MTFPIRPLHDTVFIRRVDPPRSSIIITPDSAKGSPKEGIVLAVGPGRELHNGTLVPTELQPGDYVYFVEGWPAEMKFEGEEVLRMQEEHVIARRQRECRCKGRVVPPFHEPGCDQADAS